MVSQPYVYRRATLTEPDWRRFPGWSQVTAAEWESVQWQRAHCVKNLRQLRDVAGPGLEESTDIGPLASEEHWQKVCRYFEIAEADGAKLLTGGPHEGWWVRPTVLVNTSQEMRISREEIFGPIVTIAPFDGEADAIRLANDSRYGLNAMVFTENARRAHRVARAVRAGTVWVNCYFVRDLRAPFGGFKDSGIGREGGKHSREFFTEAKTVVMEI